MPWLYFEHLFRSIRKADSNKYSLLLFRPLECEILCDEPTKASTYSNIYIYIRSIWMAVLVVVAAAVISCYFIRRRCAHRVYIWWGSHRFHDIHKHCMASYSLCALVNAFHRWDLNKQIVDLDCIDIFNGTHSTTTTKNELYHCTQVQRTVAQHTKKPPLTHTPNRK